MLTRDLQHVALTLMEGLACPRSVTVAILLRHNDWEQIYNLDCKPRLYSDSESYFRASAATSFFKKLKDGPEAPNVDKEAATLAKWQQAEKECYRTNERLSPLLYGGSHGSIYGERIGEIVSKIRKKMLSLIGAGPGSDLDGRFGPGATLSDKAVFTTVPDKIASLPTFYAQQSPLIAAWFCDGPGRFRIDTPSVETVTVTPTPQDYALARGNVYFTAPKNALVERPCGKEASGAVYYQLGLGQVMRRKLKQNTGVDLVEVRFGRARQGEFNLSARQELHRDRAKRASEDDFDCTIDLRSASDTVAFNLVKLLLPHAWFERLNLCRAAFTRVNGAWHRLEKFSSMGNGFTFELETVIFLAIVTTICEEMVGPIAVGEDVLVYGDDLIFPSICAPDVIAALRFFGFETNNEKSFVTSDFKESCGGDYWRGVGVRPFSLKELPNEPQQIIAVANGIRRMAVQDSAHPNRWRDLRRAWFRCLDLLPAPIRRLRGPQGLGDVVIHDDESAWTCRVRNSIRYVRVYRPARYKRVRWEGFPYEVQFGAALYRVDLQPKQRLSQPLKGELDRRYLIPRDGVTGYKIGWVPYS